MNTKYSDVFELFLAIMKSYEIDEIIYSKDEETIKTLLLPYIKYASGELENNNSQIDISDRNDELGEFNQVLSDGKQLIIAELMLIGYLSSETYDILQMKLHLQDGDFKTYAEKNNLDGKMNALYSLKEEVSYKLKKIGYKEFVW